jgi:hypothetical protein
MWHVERWWAYQFQPWSDAPSMEGMAAGQGDGGVNLLSHQRISTDGACFVYVGRVWVRNSFS